MIKVYATTEDGEGFVQPLGEYDSIDEIRIYSAALGPHVLITFFDDYDSDEVEEREAKYTTTTVDDEDEDPVDDLTPAGNERRLKSWANTTCSPTDTSSARLPRDLGSGEIV